jgi:tyrosyl-tRNA synthetase
LEVDIEMGGTDQTFNMLAGRTLLKKYKNKDKFVITTTLLENPLTGEKLMSKSLGTGIGLDEEPNEMFGKIMRMPDEVIVQVFIDCTYKTLEEIKTIEKKLKSGENPRNLKIDLAFEVVKMYHDEKEAEKAKDYFINTFKNKEIPDEILEFKAKDLAIVSILVESKFCSSTSDARRQLEQGAIKVNGEKISSLDYLLKKDDILQKGKRFFLKIK